jgi:predicted GNAT family acetyltransferase
VASDPVETNPDADIKAFAARHQAALERNEAKNNVVLGLIERLSAAPPVELFLWSGQATGACAMQEPLRPLTMTNLERDECRALADAVVERTYPAAGGTEDTARWFVERATENGQSFEEGMPQAIHALQVRPNYPGAPGRARRADPSDIATVYAFAAAFTKEVLPHDSPPSEEHLLARLASGRHTLWEVDGMPVALAAFARETRRTGTISLVYTPPEWRGRGFAGSVTAAVADAILDAGKTSVCLYTDLRNPFSNRCYAKIGFQRVASAWHFPRRA